MLGLDDPAAEEAYQDIFRRRFPRIEFATFDSDHFMAGLREQVAKRIHMFLEAASADST